MQFESCNCRPILSALHVKVDLRAKPRYTRSEWYIVMSRLDINIAECIQNCRGYPAMFPSLLLAPICKCFYIFLVLNEAPLPHRDYLLNVATSHVSVHLHGEAEILPLIGIFAETRKRPLAGDAQHVQIADP